MPATRDKNETHGKSSGSRIARTLAIVLLLFFVIAVISAVWIKRNVYASKFTPVSLNKQEQQVLEAKLARLPPGGQGPGEEDRPRRGTTLNPEPYSEEDATREISLTERELNGLIANTPELGERVAIDLSDDLISVKMVLPIDEEIPVLGGKTLKFHMGLAIRDMGSKPSISLKGVSLGGIPVPNAWLGHLKNVDLIEEFGTDDGFWKSFSDGVQTIQVRQGRLRIVLRQ